MKKQNELSALSGVLAILPYLKGIAYDLQEGSADESNSATADVDFILLPRALQGQRIAVEHTVVEAFIGQRTYVDRSYAIVGLINEKCRGNLPADKFFLLGVPEPLETILRRSSLSRFVHAVVPWICETAHTLHFHDYAKMIYQGHEILMMGSGSDPELNGTIGRIPVTPPSQSELSAIALSKAIDHGLAKLSSYHSPDCETILLLEDISGALHIDHLLGFLSNPDKSQAVTSTIDYIIEFASIQNRMITAAVWKERELIYKQTPYDKRFRNNKGHWHPLE